MLVISVETDKDQKEIMDKAVKYFVDNVGLKITERDSCCVSFQSQLGYVNVTVKEKGDKLEVVVESREYDYYAKNFVREFK